LWGDIRPSVLPAMMIAIVMHIEASKGVAIAGQCITQTEFRLRERFRGFVIPSS